MDWQMLLAWVHDTTVVSAFPLIVIAELCRITNFGMVEVIQPSIAWAMKPDGVSPLILLPVYLFMMGLAYCMVLSWAVFVYGNLLCTHLTNLDGPSFAYLHGPTMLVGAVVGMVIARRVTKAIDARFGLEYGKGISFYIYVMDAMGMAYVGIKAAKLTAKAVKKI